MYSKINITATVALAVVAVLFLVLTSCAKPHVHNEDTQGNAHVAQVEAEAQLRNAKRLYAGGVRIVPSQMKPGTYFSRTPKDVFLCYWARLRDTEAKYNSIIANGFQKPGRIVYVTIQADDYAFESRSCGTWKEILNLCIGHAVRSSVVLLS